MKKLTKENIELRLKSFVYVMQHRREHRIGINAAEIFIRKNSLLRIMIRMAIAPPVQAGFLYVCLKDKGVSLQKLKDQKFDSVLHVLSNNLFYYIATQPSDLRRNKLLSIVFPNMYKHIVHKLYILENRKLILSSKVRELLDLNLDDAELFQRVHPLCVRYMNQSDNLKDK